jgi:hypothetical protein
MIAFLKCNIKFIAEFLGDVLAVQVQILIDVPNEVGELEGTTEILCERAK